jgi:CelD/BcsL family acetyltransferase involved in cellulose biosynthesis
LGGFGWVVLLRYWKEGRVVEEQVLARAPGLTPAASLETEVIRDADRFNSIATEWDRLAGEWAVDRLFLSHTWFRTWWEAFGEGNELHVATVWRQGRLMAAAPMMRTTASIYGFKALALQSIYNPHTPRFDFIVGNNQDPILYEALWSQIRATADCELIMLAQVPEISRTTAAIEGFAAKEGWLTGQWVAPTSPFISLTRDYEAYFSGLPSGCRFKLTKRHAKLLRLGAVDMEVVTERDCVEEAMRDGLRIEAAAWKGREGTAMLSDPTVAAFYIRLAKRQADLGQLRLTFLRLNGRRISFNYLLQSEKTMCAVKIGYDPQFHAYSPGNMLLNLILKDACARGVEEYDLLGGDDEWKFDWTRKTREHRWLFLFRDRLRPKLLHHLKFGLVPVVKKYVHVGAR